MLSPPKFHAILPAGSSSYPVKELPLNHSASSPSNLAATTSQVVVRENPLYSQMHHTLTLRDAPQSSPPHSYYPNMNLNINPNCRPELAFGYSEVTGSPVRGATGIDWDKVRALQQKRLALPGGKETALAGDEVSASGVRPLEDPL